MLRRSMILALRVLVLVTMAGMTAATAWASSSECSGTLSSEDQAAIRKVTEAYRTSWLAGDAKGVMNTLAPDAVLLPAHGAPPIVGTDAITNYWWPAGSPPATITRLDITIEGFGGDCRFAYAHGRDDVAWTMEENGALKEHGHPGTYLNVFRKMPDGSWRISHHMWDDGASR